MITLQTTKKIKDKETCNGKKKGTLRILEEK